jgi:hypothetical protein
MTRDGRVSLKIFVKYGKQVFLNEVSPKIFVKFLYIVKLKIKK